MHKACLYLFIYLFILWKVDKKTNTIFFQEKGFDLHIFVSILRIL